MHENEPQAQQMQQAPMQNAYLDHVLEKQAKVDRELRPAKRAMAAAAPRGRAAAPAAEETARAIEYRETGFWFWRTIVVPPNAYVVHTRRGVERPLHIGLGVSFRYNPRTDAFLVIPAAMQTIIINANCICIERQGILVQAYVQWIVDDVETAYRRLDFSDPEDPMRVVNVQLREQAEAAIKDKVSAMKIDEVLADKQEIIEELTLRLRSVAEGSREKDKGAEKGLGLRIVTVQIKEAVVSSARLWENLQKPFRSEQLQLARSAELAAESVIAARELENRRAAEGAEIAAARELARLRGESEKEQWDRERDERARRHALAQEDEQRAIGERTTTARAAKEAELELALKDLETARRKVAAEIETIESERKLLEARVARERAAAEGEAAVEEVRSVALAAREARTVAVERQRREIENNLSEARVKAELVANLPAIAEKLPAPKELRAISVSPESGQAGNLLGLVAGALGLVDGKPGK